MSFTAKQYRAIRRYAEENGARPQLSIPPRIRFTLANGAVTELNAEKLVSEYDKADKDRGKA